MLKKFSSIAMCLLTGICIFHFSSTDIHARPGRKRIKIATLAPDGTPWMKTMRAITRYVENNSNGNVKFSYYAGGVMGDEPDVVRKMKMGVLNGTGVSLAGVRLTVPEFQVMELPFLFNDRNFKETDFIYGKMFKYFEKVAWERGYKLIAISEAGFAHFWTKGKIDSLLKDFPSQKVWQWEGDPVMLEISKSLDVSSVSLPMPETLTALQTGMINAFYGTPLHVISFQWNKYVDTIYTPSLFYTPSFFIFTKKTWESFPKNIQDLFFDKTAMKLKKEGLQKIHEADNESLQALVDSGIKVVTIPPEEVSEIKKRTMKVCEKLTGVTFSKELYGEITNYLEGYRK